MLESLTHDQLQTHVGSRFGLDPDTYGDLALELVEVTPLGGPKTHRAQFSAIFRGPAEPLLQQAIYGLDHEALGPLDLFLVPVGSTEDGTLDYEAVFT